jgi:LacI family transcriptional regulator, galactose operon repressor
VTPHNRLPTIADVARRANVSIATVSRVLNASTPVQPETAQRVMTAIQELNYKPRPAARMLVNRRTDTIGLLLPEISGEFLQHLLRGVESAVRDAGFDLLIHSTQDSHRNRPLGEHNTDGVLVFPESVDESELRRLHDISFPVVLLHQAPPDGINFPMVTVENQSGAKMLVSHLIEKHGRCRIAFLRGPAGHVDSLRRERGYRSALKAHSIPFVASRVGYGGFAEKAARETIESWLLDGQDFDAVFAGDDDSALGVIAALKQAGKHVPGDVAVVGFDDIPFARIINPPLTTIRAPIEQVGREAVKLLVKCIRHQHCEATVLLPTELIIRQSCGCEPVAPDKEEA